MKPPMKKLTIGIDASRAAIARATGTERYSLRILTELLDQGADYRIRLYLNQRQTLNLPQRADTEQRPIPFPRLWTHLRLSAELVAHPVDVLFVPAHVVPPLHPAATVVTIHDLGYLAEPQAHTDLSRRYLDWSTRWSVRAARKVIAISEATKSDLIEHYHVPPERISVVYHGIDEQFRPAEPNEVMRVRHTIGTPGRYILFVGTLHPRKNLVRLVVAFEEIADADPEVSLVLAGGRGWKMYEIDRAIASSRHRRRIVLPGRIPDSDLPALYSGASALALPSLYEGFGLPALEAMACGTPVLVSDRGSLPEIVANAAIVVDALDSAAINAGLRQVLDPAIRQHLVKLGKQRAAQFRWPTAGRDTLEILVNSYANT